jgi:predicted HAD superfamily Cof-like phosphohydrolase
MTKQTESDIIDLIFDFNEQVIGTGDVELNALTEKQHKWTQTFVTEELAELQEAFDEQDIVKMVDAVGDLIYGAMGTFKKMGLSRDHVRAVFQAIHNANMTKKRGDKGRGSDEDAVKPVDFVPPEEAIAEILFLE